jgi:hypothetical protein
MVKLWTMNLLIYKYASVLSSKDSPAIEVLWPELAALAAIGLTVLMIAVWQFRKTVG